AGTASHLAETTGAWGCGKRSAFPTSPHPRRRPRTIVQRGVTLTFHLVQKIGQVMWNEASMALSGDGVGLLLADAVCASPGKNRPVQARCPLSCRWNCEADTKGRSVCLSPGRDHP